MMFASKTPRDLNRDPKPLRCGGGGSSLRHPVGTGTRCGAKYEPRPEYDHPQHNEPNPILAKLRTMRPGKFRSDARVETVFDWANGSAWDEAGRPDDTPGTRWDAYERHALRVITRLARFTEQETPA